MLKDTDKIRPSSSKKKGSTKAAGSCGGDEVLAVCYVALDVSAPTCRICEGARSVSCDAAIRDREAIAASR